MEGQQRPSAMAENTAPHASEQARVNIRDGVAADLSAVIALDAQVTGLAKPDYWQDLFDEQGSPRHGQRFFLIAEDPGGDGAGRVLGFIIGEARAWEFGSPPCGWVFAISVDPDARLSGIGSQLLDEISERFRRVGVNRMRTMLARDNHLLMSFFRSHGMMAGPYIELEKELGADC